MAINNGRHVSVIALPKSNTTPSIQGGQRSSWRKYNPHNRRMTAIPIRILYSTSVRHTRRKNRITDLSWHGWPSTNHQHNTWTLTPVRILLLPLLSQSVKNSLRHLCKSSGHVWYDILFYCYICLLTSSRFETLWHTTMALCYLTPPGEALQKQRNGK